MMHLLIITYLQIAFHPLSRSAAWRPGAGKAPWSRQNAGRHLHNLLFPGCGLSFLSVAAADEARGKEKKSQQ